MENHYLGLMRLISWNVNGIRAAVGKGLHDKIADLGADVMGFQETKAQDDQVQTALFGIDGHLYSNSAERKGYSGTAVISKVKPINVEYGLPQSEHNTEGRAITLEYEKFYLVNTYVPNSGRGLVRLDYRTEWDRDMLNYLKELEASKPVVFCGDLNVAHEEIDLARPKQNYNKTAGYTQREIDGMDNYIAKGFIDSFRQLHPDEVRYSWWSVRAGAREKNIGWRLDYFLVSPSLVPQITKADILTEVMGSDHCPVVLELNV